MQTYYRQFSITMVLFVVATTLVGQNVNRVSINMCKPTIRKELTVPNIDGYITLKGDFHIHTVFSDGSVWPTQRIDEAWADGLDVIAITDHAELKPNKEYLKGDNNSSYNIAKPYAEELHITLVKAIEITKWKMPPGHINALFITDGNVSELDDTSRTAFYSAIDKFKKQGAFFIWNHPGWDLQQPDTTKWFGMHQKLYEKGCLNGIEVFNYNEWYPIVLRWAMDKKIAPFANSDAHEPIELTYIKSNDFIRPITLIFAKDNSAENIKEAMFAGRTAAWFNGEIAGSELYLSKLFDNSLRFIKVNSDEKNNYYEIDNHTDFSFSILIKNKKRGNLISLVRKSKTRISMPKTDKSMVLDILNWHIDVNKCLTKVVPL